MDKDPAPHIDTLLQHTATAPFNPQTGSAPVNLPSMRASTVRFQNLDALEATQRRKAGGERAAKYGRMGMDTHAALEQVFRELESGTNAYLASSGMAGLPMVLASLLSAGDHALGAIGRAHV